MGKQDVEELLKFLEPFPTETQQIALALREWVWDLYPKCNELIYDNYNFLAFGWTPTTRMSDIFCNIAVGTRGVIFGFMWGIKLDDPKGILQGGGSQFRSVRVPDLETFPKTYLKGLIKQAYIYSIAALGQREAEADGRTIVKSISEKKRRPGMPKRSKPQPREKHEMPGDVLAALEHNKLLDRYEARPAYQRNDYIGWITDAKRDATRSARLAQMLDELRSGDRYMKMPYKTAK